jgi:flagella basal body P-ring formation protein FlgA
MILDNVKPSPRRRGSLLTTGVVAASMLAACFAIPQTTLADPAGRTQSIESIRRAATARVRVQLGGHATRAVLTAGELDPRLRLNACQRPLEATLPAETELRSEVNVRVNCRVAGWTVYVPVHIEVDLPVLILQRPVAAGVHLQASDVIADTRRVAGVLSEFLPDVASLSGHHSKRPLPAGTVLVADMLAADPLVVRGQQVTLLAALGGLEVRAPGRVLNDAAVDTRVQVQNLSSQRIVEGVVESADTVRVTP